MPDTVSKLKDLLFDREAATLDELSRKIELVADTDRRSHADLLRQLEEARTELAAIGATGRQSSTALAERLAEITQRVGTPNALRSSVAEVIDEVIVEARETAQKQEHLSRALAPMMIRTIKAELKNNQAEMIEVLYPITGQLVKAYVASAMKDMMRKINRRLEANPLMLRVRSVLSGYSMAELALAESGQIEVDELYLIRRGSGELITRWPEAIGRSNSDTHISGVIAAINDFAAQSFQSDGGTLRAFDLDDFKVFLRASPVYLLAAKCRGETVSDVETMIDKEFLETVARQRAIDETGAAGQTSAHQTSAQVLADLKDRLETGIGATHERLARAGLPFSPLKALTTVAVLALLAGGGWLAWISYEVERTRARALAAIEVTEAVKGFPVILDVGYRGQSLGLSGLAPSQSAKEQLVARMRAAMPLVDVRETGLAVLPASAPDVRPQIAEVRRDLGQLGTDVTLAGLHGSLDRAVRRLQQTGPDLTRLAAVKDQRPRIVATAARSQIDGVVQELMAQRAALQAQWPTGDRGGQAAAIRALGESTANLARVADQIATLFGSEGPLIRATAAGTAPPPATIIAAVEEVSLAAERVATLTAAAMQAAMHVASIPEPPRLAGPTPRQRLETFARLNAVFFADRDEYRAPETVDPVLKQLVTLIGEAKTLVRVVGYTDERGGPGSPRNNQIAQSRANKVMEDLLALGAPRELLVAIGRSTGPDLSPSIGPQSTNRRVEFELGFLGEVATTP